MVVSLKNEPDYWKILWPLIDNAWNQRIRVYKIFLFQNEDMDFLVVKPRSQHD